MTNPHVLITRTRPGAQRLATRLADIGIDATLCPMLEVENFGSKADIQKDEHGLILTSSAAIANAPAPETYPDIPVFCVGAETALLAKKAGYQKVQQGSGTGRNLARLIQKSIAIKQGKFLWCRGEVADEAMVRSLQKQGHNVRQHICYRTKKVQALLPDVAKKLASGQFAAVLFHSKRGAETFLSLRPKINPKTCALVFSRSISERLRDQTFASVEICQQPNDQNMVEMLRAMFLLS